MRYPAQPIAFTGLNLFRHQPQISSHFFAASEASRLIDHSYQGFPRRAAQLLEWSAAIAPAYLPRPTHQVSVPADGLVRPALLGLPIQVASSPRHNSSRRYFSERSTQGFQLRYPTSRPRPQPLVPSLSPAAAVRRGCDYVSWCAGSPTVAGSLLTPATAVSLKLNWQISFERSACLARNTHFYGLRLRNLRGNAIGGICVYLAATGKPLIKCRKRLEMGR